MPVPLSRRVRLRRPPLTGADLAILAAVVALAGGVAWLTAVHPSRMPVWAPWEFSWSQFIAIALAFAWYARGVALAPDQQRPGLWRQAAFLLGLGSVYAVLLTHFEYMAQHMFFLNRLQHGVMHHFGPFLIALSWPADTLLRGMPAPLRRAFQNPRLAAAMHVLQQPVLAGLLFVGLIYLWLIPSVHFEAMINPHLYGVMNWSMVIDGLFFWFLVLDPRSAPPARISFATRLIVTVAVMFPQIAMGAATTFSTRSIYAYYDLCGRLFPDIGAITDQHIGGVIIWIPSAMMSSVAFLLILNHMRRHEDTMPKRPAAEGETRAVIDSSSWTGR